MPPPKPSSELPEIPLIQDFITYRLTSLMHSLNRASTHLYAQYGVSVSEWQVLLTLKALQPITATDLTKTANVDKGLISRIVKNLTANDLIETAPDPQDARRRYLSLTPLGQDKFNQIYPVSIARDAWLKTSLTTSELKTFLNVSEKLFRQINQPFDHSSTGTDLSDTQAQTATESACQYPPDLTG